MINDFNLAEYIMTIVFPDFKDTLHKTTTQKNYEYAAKEFFFEYPNYSDFTLDNCCQFFEDLQYKKGKKYSTCVKKRRQLASLFDYAISNNQKYEGLPKDFCNYFAQVPLQEEEQVIKFDKVASLSELDALIQYTKENDMLCMLAIIFAFKMMLQVSEFMQLKWSDIETAIDGSALKIQTATGHRYLNLPEDIASILEKYRMGLASAPTFIFSNGISMDGTDKPLTSRAMTKKLTAACKRAEVTHYTFNDLRNAGITYAVSQGCPVDVLVESLDMKSETHLSRLTSLANLRFSNAADYTNIIFTGGKRRNMEKDENTNNRA